MRRQMGQKRIRYGWTCPGRKRMPQVELPATSCMQQPLVDLRSRRIHSSRYLQQHGNGASSASYIDQWFSSIVKPQEFYDAHANDEPRRYFYNIDLQGRFFLEETLPKNIATSIKDTRFLDFFFRRIRSVGTRELSIMNECGIAQEEYPFVSWCGKELNFIRPAATPIVFHTHEKTNASQQHSGSSLLIYAGSQAQEFRVAYLAISQESGRLYHKCDHLQKAAAKANAKPEQQQQYALIRSAVVVALSDQIGPDDGGENDEGLAFFTADDEPHPIPWLPEAAEPGAWAMPFAEGGE
ncbi:UPF0598 protein C8orf82 homolog [Seminavis robusta]|uniref:UPF0598 protein C8orf82 homolog n=1 Tax=Seminavis robusta TaxID=568900 RepID=A0A9N8DMA9_9STRA|nr:UPF0598 protein C8orf82 homolog [Seminavis robusta]|eukprot:Sro159_g071890.1 UPF0598 protein C8orf82 homolog (296) ;mRNA; f:70261-71338